MVSETTETSITWTWNAVEGAIGYAVQASADQVFDDSDMIHPAAETTFTASDLEPGTTMSVRVAAAGALDGSLNSAWTTHITATSAVPPPLVIPVPSGFMAEGGDGSITWSWDAVEGADGYAIQVSMDEMFDDMDETTYTMETSHTVEDLGYSESRFARVASTAGEGDNMMMSMWTTHMTGMSAAAAPLPPPSVTFSLPDGQSHFMVADDDDDEATAMAWINPKTVVESDSTAIITPMFVDGANGVHVDASDDNMPFTYVGAADNWDLLQSAVLDGGATFMVQRTTMGANQEMEPSNDVSYYTCGPFECAEGMDAPDITISNSAACGGWDPMVDIQVGKVDNDVLDPATGDADSGNDGIDLGIVTSSSLEMTVKHVFSGVANGTNTSGDTTAAKGSDKTLTMTDIGDAIRAFDAGDDATDTSDDVVPCDNTYDDGDLTDWPGGSNQGCFRLRVVGTGDAAANYLSGYSLELSPKDAGVSWGDVAWDPNPFKDLKCDSMTMMVSDEVDVCTMFEDEVDYALRGDGWEPEVVFNTDTAGQHQILMWRATTEMATNGGKNFKTLWFDDNLNGKIEKDASPARGRPEAADGTDAGAMHDLYNQNADPANLEHIWEWLTDVDTDPNAGDLGKVDMISDEEDSDYDSGTDDSKLTVAVENGTGAKTWPDGMADNYLATSDQADVRGCTEDDGGESHDGTVCDAVWTRDASVLFADGTFGCTTTREVSITCTWDADGGMAVGRNALPSNLDATATTGNLANFLKCEAE